MGIIDSAPAELADLIREFWPEAEWNNAADIARLESGWSAFAENDTTSPLTPCDHVIDVRDGVRIMAERSIGWFQINACGLPADWNGNLLFNSRHNVGTAHDMWSHRGWDPWYFSAKKLGLI
jgi:hypothetical protein